MKSTTMICLVFLLAIQLAHSLECPSQKDANVLIFGAGTAGVTAARLLYDSGVRNITILEANESNIGGRIRNVSLEGYQIEVGANWIHDAPESLTGSSNNPIWLLSRSSQCFPSTPLSGFYTESFIYRDSEGNPINDALQYEGEFDSALTRARNYGGTLSSTNDITVRAGLSREGWNPSGNPTREIVEWRGFDFSYAAAPNRVSLRLVSVAYEEGFGENDFLVNDQRGYASVVKCMARPLEDNIRLGAVVDSVDWNNECVCAEVSGTGRVCGNYGIVTFSTAVLQDWVTNSRFNGTLSSNKLRAISRSASMGLYLKLFLSFPSAFWQMNYHYIMRSDTRRGYYPVIQPISTSPNIMLMTVTGDEARRLSALTKQAIIDEIMVVLRNFYDNNIPNATNLVYHDWYTDPFFRGMYTNDPFGLTSEDRANLNVPEGRLYFSGEGNSRDHAGSVHGAYCSGIDTATQILRNQNEDPNHDFLSRCSACNLAIVPLIALVILASIVTYLS